MRLPRPDLSPEATRVLVYGLAVVIVVLASEVSSRWFPPSAQAIPLLLGGLGLGRTAYKGLVAVVAACLAVHYTIAAPPPGAMLVIVVTGVVGFEFVRSREASGLSALRGDSVLAELRRRLELQGALPHLPEPWRAEPLVRPAGDAPFAGDFVVSALTAPQRLEVALVDVSGKGVEAGTRSLLLSGALGGLLGTDQFLAAANSYLCRQSWDEGFATAVHLVVQLDTGSFVLSGAGHPPAAHFDAGSGRWSLVEANGPALGLLEEATYPSVTGVLRAGDALLVYTDGLVEVPGRDLEVGIDKLLGVAEALVPRGFTGGADTLVSQVAAGGSDDRGLVLLWRR